MVTEGLENRVEGHETKKKDKTFPGDIPAELAPMSACLSPSWPHKAQKLARKCNAGEETPPALPGSR